MELKNTIRNMFLNSLISDLDCIICKLEDIDFNFLSFGGGTIENVKLLQTVLTQQKDYFNKLKV